MFLKSTLFAAFACAAFGFAASASVVEVEYTMPGGLVERELRDMPEKDGVCVFSLSPLQYEFMEEHDEVSPGVWRTTYSDGTRIYVNYGKTEATADGISVPAEGWRTVQLTNR